MPATIARIIQGIIMTIINGQLGGWSLHQSWLFTCLGMPETKCMSWFVWHCYDHSTLVGVRLKKRFQRDGGCQCSVLMSLMVFHVSGSRGRWKAKSMRRVFVVASFTKWYGGPDLLGILSSSMDSPKFIQCWGKSNPPLGNASVSWNGSKSMYV